MPTPKKVFILNAPEDNSFLQALEKQLAILKEHDIIQNWDRSKVVAGAKWKETTEKNLQNADIVLLLVSSDYLSQKWCGEMQKKALELGKYLIPVILRPCLWQVNVALKALSASPQQNGIVVPISIWKNQDEAFQNVASAIYEVVEGMKEVPKSDETPPVKPRASSLSSSIQNIRQLLQNDRLDEAIKQLLQLVEQVNDNQLNKTAILLSSRNRANNNERINGTINGDNFDRRRNQIKFAVLSVLEEIERDYGR